MRLFQRIDKILIDWIIISCISKIITSVRFSQPMDLSNRRSNFADVFLKSKIQLRTHKFYAETPRSQKVKTMTCTPIEVFPNFTKSI